MGYCSAMTKPLNPDSDDATSDDMSAEGRIPTTATLRVLEVLSEHGDAMTTVREIDHFSYFPTAEGRSRFIEKCLAVGLKLRRLSEPDHILDRYGAILFHDDVPDEDLLLKMHEMLTAMAEAEAGNYDGWETQLIA